uniref:YkvA family protein n=1 Tax=Bradyrhizobium sp. (strain ORS 278) TaxID=114615 RepID=UPI0002F1BCF6|nr:YkvA family protein [Bradyrhizobium sp. ORS 278]
MASDTTDYSVGFEPADRLARDRDSVRRRFWIKFKQVVARIPFAEDLLAAYYCAFDKETPRHVQVALLGALAYFILPFDFLPDVMPVLGFTDDAAVLATAIRMVASHITPDHHAAAKAALARLQDDADADLDNNGEQAG